MATVYSINYTDPNEPGFIINPNQIDGSSGSASNSSLVLHGTGRLKYGEALNENMLHLLEHFASPERIMPLAAVIQEADNTGAIGTHWVTMFGDVSGNFIPSFLFDIVGSLSSVNDGAYTVVSSTYDQPSGKTTIVLAEAFPDDNASNLGNVEYTVIEPDPTMVNPPYSIGQLWFNKTDDKMYIYRNVSNTVTDIFQWILLGSGSAFESTPDEPLLPTEGMLWYDNVQEQLKVYHNGVFESVAERYVLKAGDIIASESGLVGSVGHTDGVLVFNNASNTVGTLFLNEGQGDASNAPDIRADSAMSQSSGTRFGINFDGDNTGTDDFIVTKGSHLSGSQTPLMAVENDGTLHVYTVAYETLLSDVNDIPNLKYVDDGISNLANVYVEKDGDTISSVLPAAGFVGRTDGVLNFDNVLFLNEGKGNVSNAPDIRTVGAMLLSADTSIVNAVDGNNDGTGYFAVTKAAYETTSDVPLFQIENDGTIHSDVPNYETLVIDVNDIPNKKYTDDEISAATNAITGGEQLVRYNPAVPVNGDIKVTGSGASLEIFIRGDGLWNKIFPAQYTT